MPNIQDLVPVYEGGPDPSDLEPVDDFQPAFQPSFAVSPPSLPLTTGTVPMPWPIPTTQAERPAPFEPQEPGGTIQKSYYGGLAGITQPFAHAAGSLKELVDIGPTKPNYEHHVRTMLRAGERWDYPTEGGPSPEELASAEVTGWREATRRAIQQPYATAEKTLGEGAEAARFLKQNIKGNEAIANLTESVAGMIPYIGAAMVPEVGGALAAGFGGLSAYKPTLDQAFESYREQGLDDATARKRAGDDASRNALATSIIFGAMPGASKLADSLLMPRLAAFSPKVRSAITFGAKSVEGGGMMAANTLVSDALSKWSYNPKLSWEDALDNSAEALLSGTLAVGVMHGGQYLAGKPIAAAQALRAFNGPSAFDKYNKALLEDVIARKGMEPIQLAGWGPRPVVRQRSTVFPTLPQDVPQPPVQGPVPPGQLPPSGRPDTSGATIPPHVEQFMVGRKEIQQPVRPVPVNEPVPVEPGPLSEIPALRTVEHNGTVYEKRGAIWFLNNNPIFRDTPRKTALVGLLEQKLKDKYATVTQPSRPEIQLPRVQARENVPPNEPQVRGETGTGTDGGGGDERGGTEPPAPPVQSVAPGVPEAQEPVLNLDRVIAEEHGALLDAQRRIEEARADYDSKAERAARQDRDDSLQRLDEFDRMLGVKNAREPKTLNDAIILAIRDNPKITVADAAIEGRSILDGIAESAAYDAVLDALGGEQAAKEAAAKVRAERKGVERVKAEAAPEAKQAPSKLERQFRILEYRFRNGTPAERYALDLISDNEFSTRRASWEHAKRAGVTEEDAKEAYDRLMREGGLAWSPEIGGAPSEPPNGPPAPPTQPETPSQTFARLEEERQAFGKSLDQHPVGTKIMLRPIPGAKALQGEWERVDLAGEPFWKQGDNYRTGTEFSNFKSYIESVTEPKPEPEPPKGPLLGTVLFNDIALKKLGKDGKVELRRRGELIFSRLPKEQQTIDARGFAQTQAARLTAGDQWDENVTPEGLFAHEVNGAITQLGLEDVYDVPANIMAGWKKRVAEATELSKTDWPAADRMVKDIKAEIATIANKYPKKSTKVESQPQSAQPKFNRHEYHKEIAKKGMAAARRLTLDNDYQFTMNFGDHLKFKQDIIKEVPELAHVNPKLLDGVLDYLHNERMSTETVVRPPEHIGEFYHHMSAAKEAFDKKDWEGVRKAANAAANAAWDANATRSQAAWAAVVAATDAATDAATAATKTATWALQMKVEGHINKALRQMSKFDPKRIWSDFPTTKDKTELTSKYPHPQYRIKEVKTKRGPALVVHDMERLNDLEKKRLEKLKAEGKEERDYRKPQIEDAIVAQLEKIANPPKELTPQQIAAQAGIEFKGDPELGLWEFKFAAPGSAGESVSITVKKGATLDEILKRKRDKIAEYVADQKAKAEKAKVEKVVRPVEEMLTAPVIDVADARNRVQAVDRRQAELRDDYKKLDSEIKALEKIIKPQRGNQYARSKIKASAKKSDVAKYRDLQKQIADIGNQLHALDEAAKKDRQLIDQSVDATIINDPNQPLLRRLDRKVRSMEGNAPPEMIEALRAETARVIREKYPDATDAEVAHMTPEVQRAAYFGGDLWGQYDGMSAPNLFELRRRELATALSNAPRTEFSEELQAKLNKFSTANRVYGTDYGPVQDLSSKQLADLKQEIQTETERVRADLKAKEEQEAARKAKSEAEEKRLIDEAEQEVASAKPGTGKAVKAELISRIKSAIDRLIASDDITLTEREDQPGEYTAKSNKTENVAFGTVEKTKNGFKVTANRPTQPGVSINVKTVEEAQWVIKAMAATGDGRAIIGVPGDGLFRLLNSGDVLLKVWRDARGIETFTHKEKADYVSSHGIEAPPTSIKTLDDWREAKAYHGLESLDKISTWSPALLEVAKKVNPESPETVTAHDVDNWIDVRTSTRQSLGASPFYEPITEEIQTPERRPGPGMESRYATTRKPDAIADDLRRSQKVLWTTTDELNRLLADAARRRDALAQPHGHAEELRAGEQSATQDAFENATIILEKTAPGDVLGQQSNLLAHRLLYGTGEAIGPEAFREGLIQGDPVRAILAKLPGLKFVVRENASGRLMEYNRDPWGEHVAVDAGWLRDADFTKPEVRALWDAALVEEMLHSATLRTSTEQELADVWHSLSPQERTRVRRVYTDEMTPLAGGAEYVRMILQDLFTGTTTELHRPGITAALKRALSNVLDFLRSVFGQKPKNNIAAQIIERVEAAVRGEPIPPVPIEGFGESVGSLARTTQKRREQMAFGEPLVDERLRGAYGDTARLLTGEADRLKLSPEARRYLGLPRMGRMLDVAVGGDRSVLGYDQARTAGNTPNEKWHITRDAMQSQGYVERDWQKLDQNYSKARAEVTGKQFQQLLQRVSKADLAAEVAKQKAEIYRNVTATKAAAFLGEMRKAQGNEARYEALREDLDLARNLGQFSDAIGKQMDGIVSTVYPDYWKMGAASRTAQGFYDLYLAVMSGRGTPVTDRKDQAYARLASEVLAVNRGLTEKLFWAERLQREPDLKQAVSNFGKAFTARLVANPDAAIGELVSRAGTLSARETEARAAFEALHERAGKIMRRYQAYADAKQVKDTIQNSAEWKRLVNLVNSDAGAFKIPEGLRKDVKQGRFNEFSGKVTQMDPQGRLHEFDLGFTKQEAFDAGDKIRRYLDALDEWLVDPANENDPAYPMWERQHDFFDAVYNTFGVISPTATKAAGPKILRASWDMPEFLFYQAKIPQAVLTQRALSNWARAKSQGDQWVQATVDPVVRKLRQAARSHGLWWHGGLQPYRELALNSIAWAYRHNINVRAGDKLHGVEITKQDLDAFNLIAGQETALFNLRRNLGVEKTMLNELSFDEWAEGVFILRKAQEFGARPGTTTTAEPSSRGRNLATEMAKIKPADTEAMLDLLEQPVYQPWVTRWLTEKSADYSKLTAFDEEWGAGIYRTIADKINDGDPDAPHTARKIIQYIADNAVDANGDPYDPKAVKAEVLGAMRHELDLFHREIVKPYDEQTDTRVMRSARESGFTTAFKRELGNSFMYDYGFINRLEAQSVAIDSASYHLNRFNRSLDGLVKIYGEAMRELSKAQGDPAATAEVMKRNRKLFRSGDDFRDLEDMQLQIKELKSYLDRLPIWYVNNRLAYNEAMRPLNRITESSIRMVLSGFETLAKIPLGSTVKEAYTLQALYPTALASYPVAIASMALSLGRLMLGVPVVTARRIGRRLGALPKLDKEFSSVVEEMFRFMKYYDQQADYGLIAKTPIADAFWNRIWMPSTKGGGYQAGLSENAGLRLLQRLGYGAATAIESISEPLATIFPGAAYAVQYDSAARQTYWVAKMLEHRLRRTFDTYEKLGTLDERFNLNNPTDPKNILKPHEVIARGLLPTSPTQVAIWSKMIERGMDIDLNKQAIVFFKKLAETPKDKRNDIHLFSADAKTPEEAARLEHERQGALASESLANVHHSTVANRPWFMRQNWFVRLWQPILGWPLQSLRQLSAYAGHATGDRETSYRAVTLMAAATTLAALAAFGVMGDTEKRLRRQLKWWAFHEVSPLKTIEEGKSKWETAEIAVSDMLTYNTVIEQFVESILSGGGTGNSTLERIYIMQLLKNMGNYVTGVIKTGDPTYNLGNYVKQTLPFSKVLINRLPVQAGISERNAVRTAITKYAPEDLVRHQDFGTSGPTALSSLKQHLVSAIYKGDPIGVQAAYAVLQKAAIEQFQQRGDPNATQKGMELAQGSFRSMNPYAMTLASRPTEQQRADFLAKMPDRERQIVENGETNYMAAAQMLGIKSNLLSEGVKGQKTEAPVVRSFAVASGASRATSGSLGSRRVSIARLPSFGRRSRALASVPWPTGGTRRISLGRTRRPRYYTGKLRLARSGRRAQRRIRIRRLTA